MSGSMAVLASTKFVPANPVVTAYMRNVTGTGGNAPLVPEHVGVGHYRVSTPDDLDPLRTSITAEAQTAAGAGRIASVVLTPGGGVAASVIDIFLRSSVASANGVLVDTADFVEVTLKRVPDSRRETLASMIFTPTGGAAVTVFAARNCTGLPGAASDAPIRDGAGRYHFFVETAMLNLGVSITTHATNAAGENRSVKAVLGAPVGNRTRVDVLIDNGTPAASDDALFVEVTFQRLPL